MRAKKHFSQNFLQDKAIIHQIIQVMAIHKNDKYLEIGPGMGALTERLANQCAQLIALEIDQNLATDLQKQFAQQPHIIILHQDALKFSYHAEGQQGPYRLVSNLPYHLCTAFVQQFITNRQHISDMHLMMQKEVAERLLSTAGRTRGWLSVMIELLCDADYLFDVPRESFYPVPAVNSAFIKLRWKADQHISQDWLASLQQLLMAAFRQKRKTLYNNLAKSPWQLTKTGLDKLHIDGSLRAEQLSLEDFLKLHDHTRSHRIHPPCLTLV